MLSCLASDRKSIGRSKNIRMRIFIQEYRIRRMVKRMIVSGKEQHRVRSYGVSDIIVMGSKRSNHVFKRPVYYVLYFQFREDADIVSLPTLLADLMTAVESKTMHKE